MRPVIIETSSSRAYLTVVATTDSQKTGITQASLKVRDTATSACDRSIVHGLTYVR
jgi:hypothetical protein